MLPSQFAELERFAPTWCLATEHERWNQRMSSSMDELRELYDAVLPRVARGDGVLRQVRPRRPARGPVNLLRLVYSFVWCRSPWSCGARPTRPTPAAPTSSASANRCPDGRGTVTTRAENELMTRIEGDAPMGQLMREHYWVPFAQSAHLVAGDGPLPVRLFGENYVAFRADDGRVGFLDELCPHRRASLVLGPQRGRRRALHLPRLEGRRVGPCRRVPDADGPGRAVCRQRGGRPLPGPRGRRPGLGVARTRRGARLPHPPVRRRGPLPLLGHLAGPVQLAPGS